MQGRRFIRNFRAREGPYDVQLLDMEVSIEEEPSRPDHVTVRGMARALMEMGGDAVHLNASGITPHAPIIIMPANANADRIRCLRGQIWARAVRWARMHMGAPETISELPAIILYASTPEWAVECVTKIVRQELMDNGNP